MFDDIRKWIEEILDIKRRLEKLERASTVRTVTIPNDGKLIVDSQAADPTPVNGRIYYNSVANKYKVCENGVWKTITTS